MSNHNPKAILENVENYIKEMEASPWKCGHKVKIWDVCESIGIFDWWNEYLSLSQLKQMRSFLKTAIKLGYTGYACFKVGAAGCSHGMWANKKESTNGYSPDGACLFHPFRNGDNYWSYCDDNDNWHHGDLSLKELKEALASGSGK